MDAIGDRTYYDHRIAWGTQCPTCPDRDTCRHDCGHPGWMEVHQPDGVRLWRLSGKVTLERINREFAAFLCDLEPQQQELPLCQP